MSQAIPFPSNGIFGALEDKFLADPASTFDSPKNRRALPVWASRDRKFCEIAECADDVLSYEDRPDILPLKYRLRDVFYVIDFRVRMRHSTVLVGLSLFGKPGHKDEEGIHELARAYCARRGEEFIHIPDSDLVRLAARIPCSVAA